MATLQGVSGEFWNLAVRSDQPYEAQGGQAEEAESIAQAEVPLWVKVSCSRNTKEANMAEPGIQGADKLERWERQTRNKAWEESEFSHICKYGGVIRC